jgi:hypothetical protein
LSPDDRFCHTRVYENVFTRAVEDRSDSRQVIRLEVRVIKDEILVNGEEVCEQHKPTQRFHRTFDVSPPYEIFPRDGIGFLSGQREAPIHEGEKVLRGKKV